jgi:hypothetical protein
MKLLIKYYNKSKVFYAYPETGILEVDSRTVLLNNFQTCTKSHATMLYFRLIELNLEV